MPRTVCEGGSRAISHSWRPATKVPEALRLSEGELQEFDRVADETLPEIYPHDSASNYGTI